MLIGRVNGGSRLDNSIHHLPPGSPVTFLTTPSLRFGIDSIITFTLATGYTNRCLKDKIIAVIFITIIIMIIILTAPLLLFILKEEAPTCSNTPFLS